MTRRVPRRDAFARADLLAAAGLGLLALVLLLPAAQKLRGDAARAGCADHLRRIGQGADSFAAANDGKLPRDSVATPYASWNTEILPHIGEAALARKYSPGRDWWLAGDDGNRAVAATRVGTFVCPAAPHSDRWVLTRDPDDAGKSFRAAPTDYVGSAGAYYENNDPNNLHPGAMHHRKITRRIRVADIQDGASNTLLVVEMADKPNGWRAGKLTEDRRDTPQGPALAGQWAAPNWNHLRSHSADGLTSFGPCAVNCSNGAAIYGFHPGGANVLMVDGSVRFLKAGLSQEMLIALVSIAGGELIGPNDF